MRLTIPQITKKVYVKNKNINRVQIHAYIGRNINFIIGQLSIKFLIVLIFLLTFV